MAGKWKSTRVQTTTELWDIAANGDDGLTMKIVDYDAVCTLKFDSKDYPCTGPTIPKSFTMAATVSGDGKTLTGEGAAAGTNEKVKTVYEKQ